MTVLQPVESTAGPTGAVETELVIACHYCSQDVPVDVFLELSGSDLVAATCACGRTMTMANTTLRRRTVIRAS
jgi:hypothetical protein